MLSIKCCHPFVACLVFLNLFLHQYTSLCNISVVPNKVMYLYKEYEDEAFIETKNHISDP